MHHATLHDDAHRSEPRGTKGFFSHALSVAAQTRVHRQPMLFPNTYVWFVFLSAMDCMMTSMILHRGGSELNHLADLIIRNFDIAGMVAYKFVLVTFVIWCCEVVGRVKTRTGKRLARAAVAITCFPVTVAFAQLLMFGLT